MSDKIFVTDIEVFGKHGCSEIERRRGQIFKVDVEVDLDLRASGKSDDINDTVDYSAIIFGVERIVSGTPRNLIETVAEEIATSILEKYALAESVRVTIHKPDAPLPVKYADAGVSIFRARK